MTADASSPPASLMVFARIEPICDDIVLRYAEQPERWCDIVFYRDCSATQFYARRSPCLRWQQRHHPNRVMLNSYCWPVAWLPPLMQTEVSDGDD